MKRKLLILCALLLGSIGEMKAFVLPSNWTWTGEEPAVGKTYYIYNTSKNQFWYSNPDKIQSSPDRYYGLTDNLTTATPIIFSGGGDNSVLKYYIDKDYYYLHQHNGNPTMTKNGSQQTMRVNGSASGYTIRNDKNGSKYRNMEPDDSNPGTCVFPERSSFYYNWVFISQEQMANYCSAIAEINYVQSSAGWEKITEMPTNPEDYYFAFVSADVPGIMLNIQDGAKPGNSGKALFYATAAEVNAAQNTGYMWEIVNYSGSWSFRNLADPTYYVQTRSDQSYNICAYEKTGPDEWTRMDFEYSSDRGSWRIQNKSFSDQYLGAWDKVRPANGVEFCGNNSTGGSYEPYIANLLIYAVRKDINALPNNSESGWTDGVYCNTWSSEANSDGTGYVTPFNQVHTGSGSLADGSYSHSFTPTQTGQYEVSAWVRATNESGGDISGATMWAGMESNSVDVCTGDAVQVGSGSARGKLAVRSLRYNATADTPFNVGFKVKDATFNWLAFKNITITYLGETLSMVATSFTSGSDAANDTWYAFSVPENASYILTSTAAATLSYSQDGGKCVNDDDFSTVGLSVGMSKCLVLSAGTFYFKSNANTTLTITVPENGDNMTKLIANPSFETGDMTGWGAISRTDTGVKSKNTDNYSIIDGDLVDGSYLFNSWGGTSENDVYQTINNMPAGTYHLCALLAGFKNETLTLSANTVNNSIVVPDNGDNSKKFGYTTSLYFTLNAATNVQIKAANTKSQTSSDASFIKADNFRLTYYENDQVQTVSDAFTSGNATTAGAWKAVTVTAGKYMLISSDATTLSYTQDGTKSFGANDFSTITIAAGASKCLTLTAGTLYFKSSAATTITLTPFEKDLDLTSCITNPNFETGDLNGWTPGNFSAQSGNDNYSGTFAEMWAASGDLSDGDLNQTINLPAGFYRLTTKSWADINCHLYASISGVRQEISYQTSEAVDRNLIFSVAATSDVVIGIYHEGKTGVTGSTWVSCDDFRLTYLGDATANLTVSNGKLGTFIAPFDITLPENVKAYSADSYGETVTLAKIAEGKDVLEAGTPVIVYGDGVDVNTNFYGKSKVTENQTAGALVGILDNSNKTIASDNYVLQTIDGKQAFYRLNVNAIGKLNRCYLTSGVGSSRLAISMDDDDPTAINAIETAEETEGLKDGKYLENGQIIIVKNGVKYSANGQILK